MPFLADSSSSIICKFQQGRGGFRHHGGHRFRPMEAGQLDQGRPVVLDKNPDYVNHGKLAENSGAPYMDRLIVTSVLKAQTRLAGLQTGEIQIAETLPDDVETLKTSG
jgi:peptide/nickel transport system substrate-binding protein